MTWLGPHLSKAARPVSPVLPLGLIGLPWGVNRFIVAANSSNLVKGCVQCGAAIGAVFLFGV